MNERDEATLAPVFVVSTGRCGSTLLSAMIRKHPQLLSISEFFTYLGPGAVRAPRVSGEAAFRRLNTPAPGLRAFLESGASISELIYPLDAGRRFSRQDVPPIMCTTLPHLTDDCEKLWDELGPELRSRERHRLMDHYRFVFEWLTRHFGRKLWVERSGGTLPMSPVLARYFPDARFVHIFRDGRDTALSMYNHAGFRAMAMTASAFDRVGLDPFSPKNWRGSSPWVHIVAAIHGRFFPPKRIMAANVDLATFGWLWSGMIKRGIEFLNTLPADQVLSIRFESLLESPQEEMTRFIEFVGPQLYDSRWLGEVSALPRSTKPRWPRLGSVNQRRLAEACAPGQQILGYNNGVVPHSQAG